MINTIPSNDPYIVTAHRKTHRAKHTLYALVASLASTATGAFSTTDQPTAP